MIELIIVSFIAGVFTVLAPCILPLLPVIVGGSVLQSGNTAQKPSLKHPIIIVLSLALSIILFTLLLKATATFLSVPTLVWNIIAGGIVLLFGLNLLIPQLWEKAMVTTGWQAGANRLMAKSGTSSGIGKDIALGMALGPVFNSCSPTYALIVAVILPVSFGSGLLYLIAYALGIAAILLLISICGRSVADRLKWLANPQGMFKKVMGIVFIVVGLAVIFGIDKHIQAYVLENGWYDPVLQVEQSLRSE